MRSHVFHNGACVRCAVRIDWPGASEPCPKTSADRAAELRAANAKWRAKNADRVREYRRKHSAAYRDRYIAEHGLDAWREMNREAMAKSRAS